jgi:hypothetical protein
MKSYKGKFTPININKYKGDPTNIRFRSMWERSFMVFCDTNSSILEWSSEETIIPYLNELDQKIHRYFVDFWLKIKQKDGSIVTRLVEIKPYYQTIPPVIEEGKKVKKSKIREIETWIVNKCKWKAAQEYCKIKGIEFLILTEKNLFNK